MVPNPTSLLWQLKQSSATVTQVVSLRSCQFAFLFATELDLVLESPETREFLVSEQRPCDLLPERSPVGSQSAAQSSVVASSFPAYVSGASWFELQAWLAQRLIRDVDGMVVEGAPEVHRALRGHQLVALLDLTCTVLF